MAQQSGKFTGIPSEGLIVPSQVGDAFGQTSATSSVSAELGVNGTPRKNNSQSGEEETFRVTIRPKPGTEKQIYGPKEYNTIMNPLYDSNGIVFPYTPTITSQFSAEYGQYSPVHSIMDFYAYQRTPAPQFMILGTFTAQNQKEARYCIAVIHFFRTITKMYFGEDTFEGQNIPIGLAPPVLLLNGYGNYMFNNLPVIITNYTIELLNNVDYVKVRVGGPQAAANATGLTQAERQLREDTRYFSNSWGESAKILAELDADAAAKRKAANTAQQGGTAYIPSMFSITATAVVQHTPRQTRKFNMESFRRGKLLQDRAWPNSKGGWW